MLLKKYLPWIVALLATGALVYFMVFPHKIPVFSNEEEEHLRRKILLQIEQIGKIELVKYRLQDAVEYKKSNRFMPDDKILLLISGEAVGCIDLLKMNAQDIRHQADTIFLLLPSPEICYAKLVQEDCKVYDMTFTKIFDKTELIALAFKQAEKHIEELALQSDILAKSKENAILLLTPLLESITKKTVFIQFLPTAPTSILPERKPDDEKNG